ncbi:MAG: YcxB family protein [Clostridia bacterium]|nr:YcxB family protein [Clostridia bacterium]
MRKANAYAIGGKYSYIITDESILIDAPRSKNEYDWSAVEAVHEFDDYIVIRFKQNAVAHLEKAQLKEDEIAWLKSKKLSE